MGVWGLVGTMVVKAGWVGGWWAGGKGAGKGDGGVGGWWKEGASARAWLLNSAAAIGIVLARRSCCASAAIIQKQIKTIKTVKNHSKNR